MMKFDSWNSREQKLFDKTAQLAQLRNSNPVLVYGDFINLHTSVDNWVYARKYFDKTVIVLINNSNQPKELEVEIPKNLRKTFKANFGSKFTLKNGILEMNLGAYASEVLL
jgi:glycosidase